MLERLLEVSVARAARVCKPFNKFCVLRENDQLVVPVAVLQAPPSMLTSTLATATLSAAVPDIKAVPANVEPLVGELSRIVGGVTSAMMLDEVTKYVSNDA